MAKSHGGFSARRKEFTKSVRAKAHKEGITFKVALVKVAYTDVARPVVNLPHFKVPVQRYKAPGKHCSDAIVVDDGEYHLRDEDIYDFKVEFSDVDKFERHPDMTQPLLDIARVRPAKIKGIRKDFSMIRKSPSSVLLDDEEFEIWEDDEFEKWEDDWEKVYDEQRLDTKKSYSSVLRENDRNR